LKLGAIMGDHFPTERYRAQLTFKGVVLARSDVVEATKGIAEITIRPTAGPLLLCSAVIEPL
jgi:hypothetical protein